MIELRNVQIQVGTFSLQQISFQIPAGCYAVLMGKTGSGKTTLLESICGLRPVKSGQILLDGKDVTRTSSAMRNIGYVPQDLALFPTMTVREHLEFALKLRRATSTLISQRVAALSRLLHLEPLLTRNVNGLSGGEAQRVALGRAISFYPSILLLDEPLSALDEDTRGGMQSLLKEVHQATGVTVLHVTHNTSEASLLADRVYLLEHGRLN